jgi:copper chaperone
MITDTISVPDIHCNHCKTSIEGALAPVKGVARAEVDVPARTVTVEFDPQATTRDALIAAIAAQGYDVPE